MIRSVAKQVAFQRNRIIRIPLQLVTCFQLVPARYRVKVTLRHTCITLPQVTLDQAQARPGGQDKGVCYFLKQKENRNKIYTLTLTLKFLVSHKRHKKKKKHNAIIQFVRKRTCQVVFGPP